MWIKAYLNQSDATLVLLTLAGDEKAYEALVVKHEKKVRYAAYSVIKNSHIAEDAAQDAFIAAWMKLDMLKDPEKYASWVCRIAQNCAREMARRFSYFMSVGDLPQTPDESFDLEEYLENKSEAKLLRERVNSLPQRTREAVFLHYFEDMSVEEIAKRLDISVGTVKWQLHDGRRKIRKELCAMDEYIDDTLLTKVMKKVEELKKWKFKNSKAGFEAVYRDALSDIELLPETEKKHHALADTLLLGYWWLPGEKNDALFDKIKEAAILGKNDRVMAFVAAKEDSKYYGEDYIRYIRDVQIPRLKEDGFVIALACEQYALGRGYSDAGDAKNAEEAYDKALELLPRSEIYHALSLAAKGIVGEAASEDFRQNKKSRRVSASAAKIELADGMLRCRDVLCTYFGELYSIDYDADEIIQNAFLCDGFLTVKNLKEGETFTGSDGTTLTFTGRETVETPCGVFENCEKWVVKSEDAVHVTYLKDKMGIVKKEIRHEGISCVRMLSKYEIKGGDGLLPLAEGNSWEYCADFDPECVSYSLKLEVTHADGKCAVLSGSCSIQRIKYDENSWSDMMSCVRNDYWDRRDSLNDVRDAAKRAEILAETPMEKAHTKAACSVVRRILETNRKFNKNCEYTGHWNFFTRASTMKKYGGTLYFPSFFHGFEFKDTESLGAAGSPLLSNDIYLILADATGFLWSDEWKAGFDETRTRLYFDDRIKTHIRCENAGKVAVKAGNFENCLKLSLDIDGMPYYVDYRGGKKEYYFAPNVGIIKIVSYSVFDNRPFSYELVSYSGTGKGYMPLDDSLTRRYEAIGLTDGYEAWSEYSYVKDEDGNTVIFEDRAGVRRIPRGITRYDSIESEMKEQALFDEDKDCPSLTGYNNLMLHLHSIGRECGGYDEPLARAANLKYRVRLCEAAGGGEAPEAYFGYLCRTCLKASAALVGGGMKEEGYEYLDRAMEYLKKWSVIPEGAELSAGEADVFAGAKIIKGKGVIKLSDGSLKELDDKWFLNPDSGYIYSALTRSDGWEWFDSVRGEKRFKDAVSRAKTLI